MLKRFLACFLVFLMLCLASGCGSDFSEETAATKQVTDYTGSDETPEQGGVLRLALSGADSLNPVLATSKNNAYVFNLIFDGLFCRASDGSVKNVLCESYSVSPDGLTYEFKIKDRVSFHSGALLTADDVSATLALLLSTENLYRDSLSVISTYESRGMNFVITLGEPVINFPALLDFPVLSKEDLQAAYNPLTYIPNGTGRYKVQSYKKSKELYLSVNRNYHKGFSPYIEDIKVFLLKNDAVAVSMLENLQIDLLSSDTLNLSAYTPKRNASSVEYDSGRFTFVGLNNQKPALISARTRFALSSAIGKSALIKNATIPYSDPAEVPLPNGSYWNNSLPMEKALEPQEIQAILTEDGWFDSDGNTIYDKDVYGERVELNLEILVNSENSTRIKVAEQVKTMWLSAGINAYVTAVPYEEYMSRISAGQFDVFIGGVSVSENYDLSFLLRTGRNVCGISIEAIDQTLNALALMDREEQKRQLYYELCDVVRQEMPLIGLYFENDALVFDQRVRGEIKPSGSDIFYGIEKWFLSKED